MIDNLITHLQLFVIGFSFGVAGPCLFSCTPVIVAFVAGVRPGWGRMLSNIFVFLSGRFASYVLLGLLAGLSGAVLRQFTSSSVCLLFKPLAGAVSILFAVLLFTYKECSLCPAGTSRFDRYGKGALLVFGFSLGMAPCAPLLAVLFDIALMSKHPLDALAYAMSFGMGTFLSGLISISVLTGLIKFIPQKFLKSRASIITFKITCAAVLVIFGIGLIVR
jgi:sulfite exporter TauE/SafE